MLYFQELYRDYNLVEPRIQPGHRQCQESGCFGPVFIIERGKPSHVLLNIDEYKKLSRANRNIADALAMPGAEDIEFDPPRLELKLEIPDFS